MSEDSISDQIYAKFKEAIGKNALFNGMASETLITAMKQNEGKIKIKEILKEAKNNANPQP